MLQCTNISSTFSKYCTGYCGFAFNGKEKDDETYGTGNEYNFGARIYNPRIGRWLSVDPLLRKYPSESPFIFAGNNPIVCIDPDGEEKIVISGGADVTQNDKLKFLTAAKNQLRQFKRDIANAKSKEGVSWLIFDKDYTAKQKTSIEAWAKKNGVVITYVSSDKEVVNYINSKATQAQGISKDRKDDQITSLSVMGHGVPSAIALGYQNSGWSSNPTHSNSSVLDNTDISNIQSGAFADKSNINMYTCNSATPVNMEAKDYKTQDELVNDAMTGDNLVKSFSKQVPQATVTGFIGQTSYMGVANGELPSPATMDGSYSPTVNKKHPSTIPVKMQNGNVK